DLRVLGRELLRLPVMGLRLAELAHSVHRRCDPAMSEGLITRGELAMPPTLGNLQGILVFLDGPFQVPLGLEDLAEVDVDLEFLPVRRRLVERGVLADRLAQVYGDRGRGVVADDRGRGRRGSRNRDVRLPRRMGTTDVQSRAREADPQQDEPGGPAGFAYAGSVTPDC